MNAHDRLQRLFEKLTGERATEISPLVGAGSARKYFRMQSSNTAVIGAYNQDVKEDEAFFHFGKQLSDAGIRVPEIYIIDETRQYYLLQDLGDISLFELLLRSKKEGAPGEKLIHYYRQALRSLIRIQLTGKKMDFSYAYPRQAFDRRSVLWDLNYFKYYFLKMQDKPFDEEALENDFVLLAEDLMKIEADYFMYRDFQARNIMIFQDAPWFIDFQGGRKGPLQYDIVSLLFQAKADLPFSLREELLDYYLQEAQKYIPLQEKKFLDEYYKVMLIRLLQVLGAYGFRGLIERKPHFVESLSYGMKNIRWYVENIDYIHHFPELHAGLKTILCKN